VRARSKSQLCSALLYADISNLHLICVAVPRTVHPTSSRTETMMTFLKGIVDPGFQLPLATLDLYTEATRIHFGRSPVTSPCFAHPTLLCARLFVKVKHHAVKRYVGVEV
jgi:hypothetical protein